MISNRIRALVGAALIASALAAAALASSAVADATRGPLPQRWCTNGTTGFYSNGDECPPGYN